MEKSDRSTFPETLETPEFLFFMGMPNPEDSLNP